MLCKAEEDEVSLLFVNDCFYDEHNAEVDFMDKHWVGLLVILLVDI
jgi:hypothetical protein